jgi:hypothetical protein
MMLIAISTKSTHHISPSPLYSSPEKRGKKAEDDLPGALHDTHIQFKKV